MKKIIKDSGPGWGDLSKLTDLCIPAIKGNHIAQHIKWDTIVPDRLNIWNRLTIRIDPDNNIWIESSQDEYEN